MALLHGRPCGLQQRPGLTPAARGASSAIFTFRSGRPAPRCRTCVVRAADEPDSREEAGSVGTADWRSVRARLVASTSESIGYSSNLQDGCWAHTLPGPEKGCLLIAHPLMFVKSQTYFSKAVIFIFAHDNTGTAGLILNRPTEYMMGKVAGAEMFCPEFSQNTLHLGGDVGKGSIQLLHSYSSPGSVEAVPGVYMAGFETLKAAVQEQVVNPKDVRIFTRYSGWAPGQLQQEVQAGVWFCAAAGPGLILNTTGREGPDHWHQVLETMGGDYKGLSEAVKETHREDVMGTNPPPDR